MRLGMFGTVTACRHVLGDRRHEWTSAMCGVCLTIRDRAGQLARATVSTDAIATAVLAADVAVAAGGQPPAERLAGPCPARGMQRADVWIGTPTAVGAGLSLLAASVAVRDRAHDGDLARPLRWPARRWADRIGSHAATALADAGIDLDRIDAAVVASREAETAGSDRLHDWTTPVADAYAAVFAPFGLGHVGARVGRITLLTDAVEDLEDDAVREAPNPILSGATTEAAARALVDDDVTVVGRDVALAVPGSLAALLWGPGLVHGVRGRLRRACAGSCATPIASDGTEPGEPVWPTADSTVDTAIDDEAPDDADDRQRRDEPSGSLCDGCDACCWTCDCCDCCDGCDCCDCGCDC